MDGSAEGVVVAPGIEGRRVGKSEGENDGDREGNVDG